MRQSGELLTVSHLEVSFAGRRVLDDVGFALRPGEFCGLIGTNGAGKTTLLRAILGLQSASSGSIRIAGQPIRRGLGSVGYVPQRIELDPEFPLRARDLVALGLDGNRLGLPLPSRRRRDRVDEMLVAVGAAGVADQRVGRLSGGEQQRVLIAHALIRRPRLLLLDEPLASLDLRGGAEIVSLLVRLGRAHGVTVLMSAHDMNPLLAVMDRIVYLAHGRAVAGTVDEVVRTDTLSALYGYPIDVIRVRGRILVVAGDGEATSPASERVDLVGAAR